MKKHILPGILALSALGLDIITKIMAVEHLGQYRSYDFLGGFLRFELTYNQGGVFGIMQGYQNFFLIVSVIVLVVMVAYYFYEKNMPALFRYSMALIIGGAVGNILDRLIPARPGVVDFISMGFDGIYRWPTYNIADSVIVIGAVLLVIVVFREEKKKLEMEKGQ
jgi:signal peptidase II